MSAPIDTISAWIADGRAIAVATVVAAKLSAPRAVGSKMAVNDIGQLCGAVSGGCVEAAVVEAAEAVLAGEPPRLLQYGLTDDQAWEIGLPCGGEIHVWVQRVASRGPFAQFLALHQSNGTAALVTAVDGVGEPGAQMLVPAQGLRCGSLGDSELDALAAELATEAIAAERSELSETAHGSQLFIDVTTPAPRLIIVGATDIAAELAAVARLAGWRPFVIDPRPRFATADRLPAAERVIVAWPAEGFAQLLPLDQRTAVAVLAHDPKLDDEALRTALASEAGYIGILGSRRTQQRRNDRLLESGVSPEALGRVSGPIGLDLGAVTNAETAISIMGEIIASRRGRSGGRLIQSSGPIHQAEPALSTSS